MKPYLIILIPLLGNVSFAFAEKFSGTLPDHSFEPDLEWICQTESVVGFRDGGGNSFVPITMTSQDRYNFTYQYKKYYYAYPFGEEEMTGSALSSNYSVTNNLYSMVFNPETLTFTRTEFGSWMTNGKYDENMYLKVGGCRPIN
ncbi:MAG: hypothetical protein HWE20_09760 [Gammaproteobacteria bacterium]|nr:hypothetical protein [Gammaproteobacteria bacterium]